VAYVAVPTWRKGIVDGFMAGGVAHLYLFFKHIPVRINSLVDDREIASELVGYRVGEQLPSQAAFRSLPSLRGLPA
jgi:hypothetical protein